MRQTKQRPARIQLNGSEIQLNCASVCVSVWGCRSLTIYLITADCLCPVYYLTMVVIINFIDNISIQSKSIHCSDERNGISMQRTPNHTKNNQQHLQGKMRVSCWRKMPIFHFLIFVKLHFYVKETCSSPQRRLPVRSSLAIWEMRFFYAHPNMFTITIIVHLNRYELQFRRLDY